MAFKHAKSPACPVCNQNLSDDAHAHISAPKGVRVWIALDELVALKTRIAEQDRLIAEAMFNTIDHEAGDE